MTAVEIINEIKYLPSGERAQVVRFVHALDDGLLTGDELNELTKRLAAESDLAKTQALKQQIVAGFYGDEQNA